MLINAKKLQAFFSRGPVFLFFVAYCILSGQMVFSQVHPDALLKKMFSSIEQNFIVSAYTEKKQMDVNGSVSIDVPVSALSKKLKNVNLNTSFSFYFDGSVMPDGDSRINLSGDLGDVVLSNQGGKDVMFSSDFNAYSIANATGRARAVNFRSFLLTKLKSIRSDILTSGRWNYQMNGAVVFGSDNCYKVTASTYIPEEQRRKSRMKTQSFEDLITFWKKGSIAFYIRKSDFMPVKIEYSNPVENISSEITFLYGEFGLPLSMDVEGDAAGVFGTGHASLMYSQDNTLKAINVSFNNQLSQSFSFDLTTDFKKNADKDSIRFMPPMNATKKSKENLKLLILTNAAGALLRMQQAGVNIKSIKF